METNTKQRRHEAPELGNAVERMVRALVARAAEGDTEAIEQLARVERIASTGTTMGLQLAHDRAGYSFTELAAVAGTTRQAVRQRVGRLAASPALLRHVLTPGHDKRTCGSCGGRK